MIAPQHATDFHFTIFNYISIPICLKNNAIAPEQRTTEVKFNKYTARTKIKKQKFLKLNNDDDNFRTKTQLHM